MDSIKCALFNSQLRLENLRSAISLGIFGNTRADIVKNIKKYNEYNEPLIKKEQLELEHHIKERLQHG